MAMTPHSQCRAPGFNSWSGNEIPRATVKRSQDATREHTSQPNKYTFILKNSRLKFSAKQTTMKLLSELPFTYKTQVTMQGSLTLSRNCL